MIQILSLAFAAAGLVLLAMLVLRMRGPVGGSGNALAAAGRRRYEPVDPAANRVSMADVAGMHRVKIEVADVIAFLRSPSSFGAMGAHPPKGILLEGPPGTGKTLLARALATESGAAFFEASASEFIEVYVGVGASRIRQLFAAARRAAPAVIFVDELDAVGSRVSGPHQEDVRTITQLLKEMDGFAPLEGVVVIGATNRADALDAALLRPGRFDRVITVDLPNLEERREILAVHARNKPWAAGVDPLAWAEATAGFAGANIESLLNEAALQAMRERRRTITTDDMVEAFQRSVAGIRSERLLSPEEKRLVAYHEAGHAVCDWFTPGGEPLQYVSILPRSRSLGQTVSQTRERGVLTEEECRARLTMLLGGRAAEILVFGSPSSGAAADLHAATELARRMVAEWGMGSHLATASEAEQRGNEVGADVERLLEEAQEAATACLTAHRGELEALAGQLSRREVLDASSLQAILGGHLVA